MDKLLKTNQELVREFHEKIGAEIDTPLEQASLTEKDERYGNLVAGRMAQELRVHAESMHDASTMLKHMAKFGQSVRCKRAELIVEEAAEVLTALSTGNSVDLADALADLAYVTYGTAVAFGIPLESVFREVHRSNMTKDINANKHHEGGTKGKGKDYSPPDIKAAMEEGKLDSFTRKRVARDLEELARVFDTTPWSGETATKVVRISVQEHESIRRCLP